MNRREIESLEADVRALTARPRGQTAANLIQMINRVNPTGRDLDRGTERRLYDLKSRLQSLFINCFPDEIEIRLEPGMGEDFVLLWHRPLGRDACHAAISGLDDDARFWIRRYMDEQAAEEKENVEVAEKETKSSDGDVKKHSENESIQTIPEWRAVSHLISVGRDAIRVYEYHLGLESLNQALKMSGGDKEAALPLLNLLVETLGSFQEALDLEPSLSLASLRDEGIRLLLGLAAANASEFERAEKFLLGVENPATAEIYLKMAKDMAERNNEPQAEKYLKLAIVSRSGGDLLGREAVQKKINELKSERLKPLEERLLNAHEFGDIDEAKRLLQSLLLEFPTSVTGRLVRDEILELERRQLHERLLGDVNIAKQKDDRRGEMNAVMALISNGFDSDGGYQTRLNELKQAEASSTLAEACQRIERMLEGLNISEAVREFLALDFLSQDQVANQIAHPSIAQAKALRVSDSPAKTKLYVSAIVEFAGLQERIQAGDYDPSSIRQRLKLVQEVLGIVPEFRKLNARIDEEVQAKRKKSAAEKLAKAEEWFRQGSPSDVLTCLESISSSDLSGGQIERLKVLGEMSHAALEKETLTRSFEQSLRDGQLLKARAIALQLSNATSENTEREKWETLIPNLTVQIDKEWRLQVFQSSPPIDFFVQFFEDVCLESPHPCLDLDAKTFMLATSWFEWIFLCVIDVESSSVLETCALKAPSPIEIDEYYFDGEKVSIYGTRGEVLRVRKIPKWSIISFSSFATQFTTGAVERIYGEPSGRYVLVHARRTLSDQRSWDDDFLIVDSERDQLIRSKSQAFIAHTVLDGERSRFLLTKFPKGRLEIVSLRGVLESATKFDDRHILSQAIMHPVADTVILAHYNDEPEENDVVGTSIHISTWMKNGVNESLAVKGSDGFEDYWVTTSRDTGLIYLYFLNEGMGFELSALNPAGCSFDQKWTTPAIEDLECCVSVDSRHSVVFYPSENGVKALRLGSDKPDLIPMDQKDIRFCRAELPSFRFLFSWCDKLHGHLKAKALALSSMHKGLSLPALKAWIEKSKLENALNPDSLGEIYLSLKHNSVALHGNLHQQFLGYLTDRYPKHPIAAYATAVRLMKSNDFGSCRKIFENIPIEEFDSSLREHICHMLGAAQYMMGDFEVAYATWESAEKWTDPDQEGDREACEIKRYLVFEEFTRMPRKPWTDDSSSQPTTLLNYLEAILWTDRLRSEGSIFDAWRILSQLGPLERFNLQIDARFADCLLRITQTSNGAQVDPLTLTYFLARFCGGYEAARKENEQMVPLPPPFENWSSERIDQLYDRAKQRLAQ